MIHVEAKGTHPIAPEPMGDPLNNRDSIIQELLFSTHLNRFFRTGPNDFPFLDSEYSTLAGTSANTSLEISSVSTKSSNLLLNVVAVIDNSRFNSLNLTGRFWLLKKYNNSNTWDFPSKLIISLLFV